MRGTYFFVSIYRKICNKNLWKYRRERWVKWYPLQWFLYHKINYRELPDKYRRNWEEKRANSTKHKIAAHRVHNILQLIMKNWQYFWHLCWEAHPWYVFWPFRSVTQRTCAWSFRWFDLWCCRTPRECWITHLSAVTLIAYYLKYILIFRIC